MAKIYFDVYECIEKSFMILKERDKGLMMNFFDNPNGKTYYYYQFNRDSSIEKDNGSFPEASFVKLSKNDLTPYTEKYLRLVRNEVFARKGYIFNNGGEMDTYFKQQEWYRSLSKSTKIILSEIEKYNVQLIKETEKSL